MNRKLTFPGGEPTINFDDLDRNNKANLNALTAAFRAYGDNYIIQGVTGTTSITAGYIMLDGEILQVDAHTKSSTHFVKVVTYDAGGDKTFNDATLRQTWQKNRATITAGSGNLAYATALRLSDTGLKKTIDIGVWDMDATTKVDITHGLTDITKIIDVSVMIRDDTGLVNTKLNSVNITATAVNGGTGSAGATTIALIRAVGEDFDNTFYDTTAGSYNRGRITFTLEP